MTKSDQTVFVCIEAWDHDGDRDGSPQVTTFSNIEAARNMLKELVKKERETGLIHEYHDPEDPEDDWEFIEEEDHFHAKSTDHSIWVDFEIVERTVFDE